MSGHLNVRSGLGESKDRSNLGGFEGVERGEADEAEGLQATLASNPETLYPPLPQVKALSGDRSKAQLAEQLAKLQVENEGLKRGGGTADSVKDAVREFSNK
jgi:hypothetical protein